MSSDVLYRAMKAAPDGLPISGTALRELGVRDRGALVDVIPDG